MVSYKNVRNIKNYSDFFPEMLFWYYIKLYKNIVFNEVETFQNNEYSVDHIYCRIYIYYSLK